MFGVLDSDRYNPDDDLGPLVKRTGAAMMAISGISVILRLVSRRLAKQPLKWDDWHVIIALPWAWSLAAVTFAADDYGKFGQHVVHASKSNLRTFFIMLYIAQIVYLLAIAFIKFSILAFYRRIFSISTTKIPVWILAGVVIAWLVANIFVGIFSCSPVHEYWDRLPTSSCVNTVRYFFGVAIPNILTDAFMMILPLPMIWKLRLPVPQKIALTFIFALGGFIIVISSLRLVTVLQASQDHDVLWSFVPLGIWNMVETNCGILLACLPSMQPLLRLLIGKKPTSTKDHSNQSSSFKTMFSSRGRKDGEFVGLDSFNDVEHKAGVDHSDYSVQTEVSTRKDGLGTNYGNAADSGIQVESKIDWRSHAT